MCVILVCKESVRPSREVLEACDRANPHGIGVAWRKRSSVMWKKGLDVAGLDALLPELSGEIVIHFRWASVGPPVSELCHPFPVTTRAGLSLHGSAKSVLFHNGTWSNWSATLAALNERGVETPSGAVSDTRVAAMTVKHCGSKVLEKMSGRWVHFDSERTDLHGDWQDWRGMKVSNLHFVHKLPRPVTSYYDDEGAESSEKPRRKVRLDNVLTKYQRHSQRELSL